MPLDLLLNLLADFLVVDLAMILVVDLAVWWWTWQGIDLVVDLVIYPVVDLMLDQKADTVTL